MSRLAGKVALITGAGSGLGRAVAQRFAAEGAKVVVTDVDPVRADAVAEDIGGNAASIGCDHTSSEEDGRAVAFAVERFGSLDIVHNNAGGPFTGAFETVDDATIEQRTPHEFVRRHADVARGAAAFARERQTQSCRLLAAFHFFVAGLKAKPNFSLYTVSKHGIIGLVRSLALELRSA